MILDYQFLTYNRNVVVMHTIFGGVRLITKTFDRIEISFYQMEASRFKMAMENIILQIKSMDLKDDLLLQCDKCKGYAVERRYDHSTKKHEIGEKYFLKYEQSKLCDCTDEISHEEIRKIEEDKAEEIERKSCERLGLDPDRLYSKDENVRNQYKKEIEEELRKKCVESKNEHCFCRKCPVDANGKKIKIIEKKEEMK